MNLTHEPLKLRDNLVGEPLLITSANPVDYRQAIIDPHGAPPHQIHGQWFTPNGAGPWPAVLVVPGSLGVAPSHLYKAELLTAAGIGCCVIDPFGTRGVTSTVANQAQYSFAASAWDVLATAKLLAERDDIDPLRIGAQGHSRGGSAVLTAATLQLRSEPFANLSLAGVYGAYPWCGHQFLNPRVGRTRVRAIIGDRDEWCSAQQVQGYMQALRLSGAEASVRLVGGAQHSFDRATPVELIEEASVAPGAPTFYLADDGTFIDPLSNEPDPERTERDAMRYGVKSGHGRRGARMGSGDGEADLFHSDMMTFWTETLLP